MDWTWAIIFTSLIGNIGLIFVLMFLDCRLHQMQMYIRRLENEQRKGDQEWIRTVGL